MWYEFYFIFLIFDVTLNKLSYKSSNVYAALVFGELWKLEPLPEERKNKWKVEMEWLLSPTNYMVELVPAKQNGANGGMLEVLFGSRQAYLDFSAHEY